MEKAIEIQSHWGTTIRNEYLVQGKDTLAVLLPGGRYTLMAPLMYYAYVAVQQAGYDILAVEYGFQRTDKGIQHNETDLAHLTSEAQEAISKCLDQKDYKKLIFIGKCLGTHIQTQLADIFADISQKHIFITPWLECIETINRADSLVIVGSNDAIFKKEHTDRIAVVDHIKLNIIDGANHDLEKGGYQESLAILTNVTECIYNHILA